MHNASVYLAYFQLQSSCCKIYLQNVFSRFFLILADEELEEAGHPDCVDFLERVLEIVDA